MMSLYPVIMLSGCTLIHFLLSSLGHPSSKIGDYIDPLICFAGVRARRTITDKGVRAGINPAPTLGDINILTANFSARNCHPVFLPAFAE